MCPSCSYTIREDFAYIHRRKQDRGILLIKGLLTIPDRLKSLSGVASNSAGSDWRIQTMNANETKAEDITAENGEPQQAHDYSYGAIYDQGTGWYAVVHQYDSYLEGDRLKFLTHCWSSNYPVGGIEDSPAIAIRHAKKFCLKKPVVGRKYPGWTFSGTIEKSVS